MEFLTLMNTYGIIYTLVYYTWQIISYRFVAYALMFIDVILFLFNMLYVISNYKILIYTIKEKYSFIKYFLYDWIRSKVYFIVGHYKVAKWQVMKWDNYFLTIVVIIGLILLGVAGTIIYIFGKYLINIISFINF